MDIYDKLEELKDYIDNLVRINEELQADKEDLEYEIECLKYEQKKREEEIDEKYELKKINPYEEYGISERDFH